jgi:hypothetical protein
MTGEMPSTGMTMPSRPQINRRVAPVLAALFTALALAGCGAEVAGGAAAVGAMQAAQAKQALAQQARVVGGLNAAQEAGAARAASAAD